MLSKNIINRVAIAAREDAIEPALYLAVIETESTGHPLEEDGKTPRLLFERHKFYAALQGAQRDAAVKAGLALQRRSPKTQYRDQGSSAARLALIAAARAIDQEAADASASWGVFQIMGSNAIDCGYNSAGDLVAAFGRGEAEQVEGGIRFIRAEGLVRFLKAKNFAGFAQRYNGPTYAQNRYDVKLGEAYKRWAGVPLAAEVPGQSGSSPAEPATPMPPDQVRALQTNLFGIGYVEVGKADGLWGGKTTGAIAAFQHDAGLPVTGLADDATLRALSVAPPRTLSSARTEVTPGELRSKGSIIARGAFATKVKGGIAAAAATATGIVHSVPSASGMIDGIKDVFAWLPGWVWPVAVLTFAISIYADADKVESSRVADEATGKTA